MKNMSPVGLVLSVLCDDFGMRALPHCAIGYNSRICQWCIHNNIFLVYLHPTFKLRSLFISICVTLAWIILQFISWIRKDMTEEFCTDILVFSFCTNCALHSQFMFCSLLHFGYKVENILLKFRNWLKNNWFCGHMDQAFWRNIAS